MSYRERMRAHIDESKSATGRFMRRASLQGWSWNARSKKCRRFRGADGALKSPTINGLTRIYTDRTDLRTDDSENNVEYAGLTTRTRDETAHFGRKGRFSEVDRGLDGF